MTSESQSQREMSPIPKRDALKPGAGPMPGILAIIISLVLFGLLLLWHVQSSIDSHRHAQTLLMDNSTAGATRMIQQSIDEARRRVSVFTEENVDTIAHLALNPLDDEAQEALHAKLKLHFPQFLAFTIATMDGKLLLDDFDGFVGRICQMEINAFADVGHPKDLRIHPNPAGYHFDIITAWSMSQDSQGLFFISFSPDWIAGILQDSQLPGHELMLTLKSRPQLIEITAQGSRLNLLRPESLNQQEIDRILSRSPVPDTQWIAVDLPPRDWLSSYAMGVRGRALLAYLIFFLLGTSAIGLILRSDRKRRSAEWRLQTANADLEFRVEQRTLELSETNQQLEVEIEAHKRDRDALQASKDSFRQMLDGLPNAIIVVDDDGIIVHSNPRATELFEYPHEKLIGLQLEKLVPPEARERHRRHRRDYAAAPSVRSMGDANLNLYARRSDGSVFPVDVGLNVLRTNEGPRFVAAVTDLSARFAVEQELRLARSWLQDLIDAMPSVLVGVDMQGRITLWNKAAEKLIHLNEQDALGGDLFAVFPWLHQSHTEIRRAIEEQRPLSAERLLYIRDDQTLHMELMVYPLQTAELPGAVIRLDDTTERIRMEQVMVQSEKMLSIGGLAAGMAHEINNPLSGILQSCQNIQRRLSPDLPGNVTQAQTLGLDLDLMQEYLQQRSVLDFIEGIRDSAVRSAKIVSDMLAFSRSSHNAFAPVSLQEILDAVVRIAGTDYDMKKKYDFKQVEVERDYDPGLGAVDCDRGQIEQVLLNMVTNAAQAMAEGGSPPYRLILRTRKLAGEALIEIQDNGPGMSTKVLERVFNPFFTTKPVGVGTGLGLSVSYFIITKQHQGSITVTSEPGKGACFQIRLPLGKTART